MAHFMRRVVSVRRPLLTLLLEGYCTSEHWAAFGGAIASIHLLLLLVASCLCYISRHIPTKFSEGKYVSIAMISNLQIFVVGVPVLIVAGSDPATSFFVRSVVIWMNDLVVVSLIFGNLIHSVSFSSEEDKVKSEIRSAIQDFSKHQEEDAMNHSWHSMISDYSSAVVLTGHTRKSNSSSHTTTTNQRQQNHEDLKQINSSWQASHSASTNTGSTSRRRDDSHLDSTPDDSEKREHSSGFAAPIAIEMCPSLKHSDDDYHLPVTADGDAATTTAASYPQIHVEACNPWQNQADDRVPAPPDPSHTSSRSSRSVALEGQFASHDQPWNDDRNVARLSPNETE